MYTENKYYLLWLNSPKLSKESKDYLTKMDISQIESSFTENKMNFGTAGIRQEMGPGTNRMNSFTYQQMAEGFAKYILNRKPEGAIVLIAHDNRKNADMYSMVCAKVLTSFGIRVVMFKDNEMKATPIASYTIMRNQYDGGIIITASHNPKNYSGFKVYNNTGKQISTDEANEIVSYMPENEEILNLTYQPQDNLISYLDDTIDDSYFYDATQCLINTDLDIKKYIPVVYTAHHGTACKDFKKFMESLNYVSVIPTKQQCVQDPNFSYSPIMNPEEPKSFELAIKYAEKTKANVIFGLDPDADRLAVVIRHNSEWYYLSGNEMGIIYTYYVLKNKEFKKAPFIVSTYVSTFLIDKIAESFNAKVYRTATGFKNIAEAINEHSEFEDFVVGFEEAIGSLNSTICRDKDGFQAAALALEIITHCSVKSMTLIDYLEQEIYPQFGYWNGGTVYYTFNSLNWKEEMNAKLNYLSSIKDIYINGFKLLSNTYNQEASALEWHFENGIWVKFRISGTEPKFKAYFNIYGTDNQNSKDNLVEFKKAINDFMRR